MICPPVTRRCTEGEAGHRRDHDRDRNDADHDQHARLEDRPHVGDMEGVDEVVPMRMRRPVQPVRIRPRLVQSGREHARERQQRERHQQDQQHTSRPGVAAVDGHDSVPRRVTHWIGRTQSEHEHHQHDGKGRGETDLTVEERQLVDLAGREPSSRSQARRGSRCRRCRTPTARRSQSRSRTRRSPAKTRQGDREELADRAGAVQLLPPRTAPGRSCSFRPAAGPCRGRAAPTRR